MFRYIHIVCLLLAVSACQDDYADKKSLEQIRQQAEIKPEASALDNELRQIIQALQLTGNPVTQLPPSSIDSPEAILGRKLFFSRTLSHDLSTACATCHNPLSGGGDNRPQPIRSDAHPLKIAALQTSPENHKKKPLPRNTSSTFNIALWRSSLFHDGRIERLNNGEITTTYTDHLTPDIQAGNDLVQLRSPGIPDYQLCHDNESCSKQLPQRLGGYDDKSSAPIKKITPQESDYWLQQFRQAFNAPDGLAKTLITERNISKALSSYQRSQVFINNSWKEYVEGDQSAISDKAKQGALLFFRKKDNNGHDCARCHSGDVFTDENFYHMLLPPVSLAEYNNDDPLETLSDDGRCLVSGLESDRFKFRTPSLLNTEVTGPWGHNGAYTSLAGIVRHMIDPFQMALNYDRRQILENNLPTQLIQANLNDMLQQNVDTSGMPFTEKEVQELVAFLLTLTDPCVKSEECLSPWLPANNDMGPMQLIVKP